jgi:hypothetical protein
MSEAAQDTAIATCEATPDVRPTWRIWLEVFAPVRAQLLAAALYRDPTEDEYDLQWEVGSAIRRMPDFLDPGKDDDGLPIVAYNALFDVRVVHPDGTERVIPAERWEGRSVFGWRTLDELKEAEAEKAGVLGRRPNEKTARPDLHYWVWRDRDGEDPPWLHYDWIRGKWVHLYVGDEETAPTPGADPRPGEIWLELFAPVRARLAVARLAAEPQDEKVLEHYVAKALRRVPAFLDPKRDDDGLPVVAFEGMFDVRVVAPDGDKRITARAEYWTGQQTFGWGALEECRLKEREGAGTLEERRNQRGGRYWVWKDQKGGDPNWLRDPWPADWVHEFIDE